MDVKKLFPTVIHDANLRGSSGLILDRVQDEWHVWEVIGSFRGHPIRVEFTETEGHPQYRFNATIYDAETGEHIGTGNGGPNWEEGLTIVHWQKLNMRWPE